MIGVSSRFSNHLARQATVSALYSVLHRTGALERPHTVSLPFSTTLTKRNKAFVALRQRRRHRASAKE